MEAPWQSAHSRDHRSATLCAVLVCQGRLDARIHQTILQRQSPRCRCRSLPKIDGPTQCQVNPGFKKDSGM